MKLIKDKNKYFFKICDRDLTDVNILRRFHQLPFKNKISFSIYHLNERNHFKINKNEKKQFVPQGVVLYRYSFFYIDLFKWINSGNITTNLYSKFKSIANITFSGRRQ